MSLVLLVLFFISVIIRLILWPISLVIFGLVLILHLVSVIISIIDIAEAPSSSSATSTTRAAVVQGVPVVQAPTTPANDATA